MPCNPTNSTVAPIPETGFVRLPQILAVIPIGKSTWWAGVKAGKYPAPVRPSPFGRVTVWRAAEIRDWMTKHSKE
jgi:prophage regulatory protein